MTQNLEAPIDNGHFTPESQLNVQEPPVTEAATPAPVEDTPAAPKEKKTPKEKVVRESQNGVTRPNPTTACGRIWDIADKLSYELRQPPARGQVVEIATGEGINAATAATQYGRWRVFNRVNAPRPSAPKAEAAPVEPTVPVEPMTVVEAYTPPVDMPAAPLAAPEVAPEAPPAPAKGKRGKATPVK